MENLYLQMINLATRMLNLVIGLLPQSPFADWIDSFVVPEWLGWLNWFFPVGNCLAIMAVWLVAIGLYYLYSIVLRWVKVIG